MSIKAVRGVADILPPQSIILRKIEESARAILECFCYREIRIPVFEETALFTRSIGGTSDIVEKQMYTFKDKKGRSLTLRPEGTASVIRAYLEHGLHKDELTRLFYMGPFFRYERPQAGRSRQFYQIGAEAIGADNPAIDAELILLLVRILQAPLGSPDLSLNSIGCSACQPVYKEKLRLFLKEHLSRLCPDCERRFEHNPLRALDCKNPQCGEVVRNAPVTGDYLCNGCSSHFKSLLGYLDNLHIGYHLQPRLVRGLDYYTKTIFEITHENLGAKDAIAAGGRFDGLVEDLGGEPAPAVGFAIGTDRVALAMEKEGEKVSSRPLSAYVAVPSYENFGKGFNLLSSLRKRGVRSEMSYKEKSLKAQLRAANRLNALYAVIVEGERFMLRDMAGSEQREVTEEGLMKVFEGSEVTRV